MSRMLKRVLCALLAALFLPALAMGEVAPQVDVLYIVSQAADADGAIMDALQAAGRRVTVAAVAKDDKAGLCGTLKPIAADATDNAAQKAWSDKALTKVITALIRTAKPQLVIYGAPGGAGTRIQAVMDEAVENAGDYTYEIDAAAETGIWVPQAVCPAEADAVAAALENWTAMDDSLLRARCARPYLDAHHGDPSSIPYPETRGEDGFLTEGEFVYEDEFGWLWAYASTTVAVEIVRYEQPDIPRVWYVSDIRFKPESETFHSQTYVNASFKGQMIYPETLAQSARMVFAMNGDYYIYREENKNTGNIIRAGKVLYNQTKGMGFPNLDTMAIRDDGSLTVYDTKTISADELLAQGDVHDALSFGPYLVRDGVLRIFNGTNHDHKEPRSSLGMIAPGHLIAVTVEGRFNKGVGPAGVTVNQLGQLLYANGANEAMNLDGGNTAVLLFMGRKINRTASKSGNGTTKPRNMSELFGVGTSELVYTDMINAK